MNNFVLILLATICWCNLMLVTSDGENKMQLKVLSSKTLLDAQSNQIFLSTAPNMPHHRVSRSLFKALSAKKSLPARDRKKIREKVQCCSLIDTGEYIKPEIAEKIINGLPSSEKSSLDILLRNQTGPLTLAELLADVSKDDSELNLPEGVELTNKAVVEALLSKNVLLNFPLTADNGIVIQDHRALVTAFHSGRLKFPLTDRFGGILRDISDALPDGAKEVLGTLLGGNVVSDILESDALRLLNYPITDAKGIPVLDVGFLLFLVAQGGFKNLKFPMINAFGLEYRDDMDLLLMLVDGGFLKNLVYPVRDSKGVVVPNKLTFVKALREGVAFRGLKYPIRDSFGIVIKRPDALMGALLNDDAARAVGFPLADAKAALLKDKLQLFLTLLDGGLNLVTFPLRDAEGNFFKDKLAFLIAIIKALRDKQGLDAFLLRTVTAISKFPLTDKSGTELNDKTELLNALLDGQALSALKFPFSNSEGQHIPNKEAFLLDLLNNGLESMDLPLTNRDGIVFYSTLDVVDALIDGSALSGLRFPLYDRVGRKVKNKEQLLQHILKNDLRYPLRDCASNEVKDFAELMSLLLKSDALDNLKFPLFDGTGGIFKNKADYLGALLKGGLEAWHFPLKDGTGSVLKGLENLLEPLLNNSILSQLTFPLTDVTGVVFNNKLDFLDSLLGGVLGLPNLNLTSILGGVLKDVDNLLESLLGGVTQLKFPLTDIQGQTMNNTSDMLEYLLKGSPGLRAIKFPLSDRAGHVLMNKQALLDILPDANALSGLRFPLTDCTGTVFKSKNEFLRRLLKGFTALNFPLIDGTGLNLPDGKSLLELLLQSVLNLLTPVLQPLAGVLTPVVNIIEGLLGGNLTIIESLLTNGSFNSSLVLRFPLSDSSGRNIASQSDLIENILNGGLVSLDYPLTDSQGRVFSNMRDFLQELFANSPLVNLEFPLRNNDASDFTNELALITSIINDNLQAEDFPVTDANNFTINSKLEFLRQMFNNQALSRFNYPLVGQNGTAINTRQALLETLIDGGLNSFEYPIFDSGELVFGDKEAFAAIFDDGLISATFKENQTAKAQSGVINDILKLLGDESSLSGDHLYLCKALKRGYVNERDLQQMLGSEKFSVLKEKLVNADKANGLDLLQLTKILDGIIELLLKKKPEMFRKLEEGSEEYSFT